MDTHSQSLNKRKAFFIFYTNALLMALFVCGLFISCKEKSNSSTEKHSEKDSSIYSSEHFYMIHHHKHIDADAEPIVLMNDEENMIEQGNITEKQRKLIELLPNAPVIYLYDLKVTDYQKLYYNPDGTPITINDTAAPKLINQAMKNFSAQKFQAAIAKLKPLLNKDDPNAFFYTGSAYYYEKNYAQALVMLNRIGNLQNNIFKQEAYWYKALCCIDLQKNDEAKTLLQHIADAQGFYATQAKKQLALLKP